MKKNFKFIWIAIAIILVSISLYSTYKAFYPTKSPDEKMNYMEAYMDGYKNRKLEIPIDSTLYFTGLRHGVARVIAYIDGSKSDTITIENTDGSILKLKKLK